MSVLKDAGTGDPPRHASPLPLHCSYNANPPSADYLLSIDYTLYIIITRCFLLSLITPLDTYTLTSRLGNFIYAPVRRDLILVLASSVTHGVFSVSDLAGEQDATATIRCDCLWHVTRKSRDLDHYRSVSSSDFDGRITLPKNRATEGHDVGQRNLV